MNIYGRVYHWVNDDCSTPCGLTIQSADEIVGYAYVTCQICRDTLKARLNSSGWDVPNTWSDPSAKYVGCEPLVGWKRPEPIQLDWEI